MESNVKNLCRGFVKVGNISVFCRWRHDCMMGIAIEGPELVKKYRYKMYWMM